MTVVKEKQDLYFERFTALDLERGGSEPAWLREIRRAAIDRFGDLGFPTTRHEEWKFTNVSRIASTPFIPAEPLEGKSGEALAREIVGRAHSWALPGSADFHALYFINGSFYPAWNSADTVTGVHIGSLAKAISEASPQLEAHLARHASYVDHSFVALNTALFEDGALVTIDRNVRLQKPIALIFVTTAAEKPHMTHPRNLVMLGPGAEANVVEVHIGAHGHPYLVNAVTELHIGAHGHPYLVNAVTELVAAENAILNYTRIQDEGGAGYHVGILQSELARSSSVTTNTISLGGLLDREENRAVLNGEGAEALLFGLYVAGGHQLIDNHTLIDHAKPHCSSREVYKGVLDGHAAGVFNGKIAVRQDAQKTDSKQSNKNLLLSDDASINTKPQLEIFADDVKCTHGATIGQIDPESIFYLRSRGIGLADARNMLIQAFANDILDRIKVEPVRLSLRETLGKRLELAGGAASHGAGQARLSKLEEVG